MLENGMLFGSDAFRQEMDEEAELAEARRDSNRAMVALQEIRGEDGITLAVDQIQFRGATEEAMVDDLAGAYEAANGVLSVRAWRLLRTMLRSEIRLRVTLRELLGRRERGGE